jgi:nondiscriminating glutamyl-tRNA synthetase
MEKVRVRFAPSPTGPLHLGGVRTALYDYLFAKKSKGDFVLRIEDTDTARFVPGAEDYILNALEWCGITPDESPRHGGPYAPYRQSERRHIYDQYIAQILQTDYAYLAFDTPEALDAQRAQAEANGQVFAYDYKSRLNLRNSLSLSTDEVQALLDAKTPYVVRFKMPIDRTLQLEDIVRGKFTVNTNSLDDKVLVKNDGMPTYHLANVVDDYEMKISHVIRGEEWLPSMGLHVLLYEAFGWQAPQFAHLSLILKPEGKGKLSKRDGDKLGFPVFPLDFTDAEGNTSPGYKEQGYLPDAFMNMLVLLGWSPGDEQEIFSMAALIEKFDLYKVNKAGARFNPEKAKWFNQQYLQQLSPETLLAMFKAQFPALVADASDAWLLQVIGLMKERSVFVKDIYEQGPYFFEAPKQYDEKAMKKAWNDEAKLHLQQYVAGLAAEAFDVENLNQSIKTYCETHSMGMGKLMMPLRLALVGELKGPDVPDLMSIIGLAEVQKRSESLINHVAS